ncbi:hypothetical protein M885DRAFT_611991 [Pelagophyceae sp. CCMP2097]|nr:hypothetical protein M885DRAFT_611991 [Pelagophyceae sp. CCMP2097]
MGGIVSRTAGAKAKALKAPEKELDAGGAPAAGAPAAAPAAANAPPAPASAPPALAALPPELRGVVDDYARSLSAEQQALVDAVAAKLRDGTMTEHFLGTFLGVEPVARKVGLTGTVRKVQDTTAENASAVAKEALRAFGTKWCAPEGSPCTYVFDLRVSKDDADAAAAVAVVEALVAAILDRRAAMTKDEKAVLCFVLGHTLLDEARFGRLRTKAAAEMAHISDALAGIYDEILTGDADGAALAALPSENADLRVSLLVDAMGFVGVWSIPHGRAVQNEWQALGEALGAAAAAYAKLALRVDWATLEKYARYPTGVSCAASQRDFQEFAMRYFLSDSAKLLDGDFQRQARLLDPDTHSAGKPKSISRAYVKEVEDYADLGSPRAQWVADWIRCSFQYETAAEMLACISRIREYFQVVKLKNGYEDVGEAPPFNFRSINMLVKFTYDGPDDSLKGAQFLGEIQILHAAYAERKKHIHVFYKVVRSADANSCWTDFGSNYVIDALKFVGFSNGVSKRILGAPPSAEQLRAVRDGDWATVLQNVSADAWLAHRPDEHQRLLLHLVSSHGAPADVLRSVLEAFPGAQAISVRDTCTCGMGVEEEKDNGWVPIMFAVARRLDVEAISYLASAWVDHRAHNPRADLQDLYELKDAKGRDLNAIAAHYGADESVVQFLADATAKPA